MALPTITDLFGVGATISTSGDLTILASAFVAIGVDTPATADALTLFSGIVKSAFTRYFEANQDQTVKAAIVYTSQAPAIRNNEFRTLFSFNCQFYGAYSVPTFDPDDV